jgi:WD40 repeat protein
MPECSASNQAPFIPSFSPDGKLLLVTSRALRRFAGCWRIENGEALFDKKLSGSVAAVASRSSLLIISGQQIGLLQVDYREKFPDLVPMQLPKVWHHGRFAVDHRHFLLAGSLADGTLITKRYRFERQPILDREERHSNVGEIKALSPVSDVAMVQVRRGDDPQDPWRIRFVDCLTAKVLGEIDADVAAVLQAQFSEDGRRFAALVWRVQSEQPVKQIIELLTCDMSNLRQLKWRVLPQAKNVAHVLSMDRTASTMIVGRLPHAILVFAPRWNDFRELPLPEKRDGNTTLRAACVSPDGSRIAYAAVSEDEKTRQSIICVIETETGKQVWQTTQVNRAVTHLCYSHDGRSLASIDDEGGVYVWDSDAWQTKWSWALPGPAMHATFSRDGTALATFHGNGTVLLFRP